ncbi:glycerate kinase [Bacteroides sp. CAG:709]|nr:glycerate kinase [Bacteroides sp. CAG:709]
MRKIVIACDSYKGCLSSSEVAGAAAKGVAEVYPDCEIVRLAVADGGEGTVDALVETLGGHLECAEVSDPLGRPVKAAYGIAGDLAIIESAAACGLTLLTKEERNPLITTTKGLGELILAAIDKGCRRFLIGLGGSATNDGGMGMISADGFLERARGLSFTVACDVDTPYIGAHGASRVFGPQKGASEEDVEILEERLRGYALKILADTGIDVSDMAGAGAAGGLGGAFRAYLGAELKRGVDLVLDQIGFDSIIDGADLVITGEGCSDYQTLKGKTAAGVLERAKRKGVPVMLVSGAIRDGQMLRDGGFGVIAAASPQGMSLTEAMRPETAEHNIYETVKRLLTNE